MKRPRIVQPRIGTLWRAESNAARVEEAKSALRRILSDPFGYEALQELRREKPHLFRGLVGRKARDRGRLAAWLQKGDVPREVRGARGRPQKPAQDRASIGHMLAIAEALRKRRVARSIAAALRLMLRWRFPRESARAINLAAKKCGQAIYEHRRYLKARGLDKSRNSVSRRISQVT